MFKEILVEVDTQVAEKEKEDRKLEIYNRIEAKSFTVYRGIKFKKSDILSKNRRLRSVIGVFRAKKQVHCPLVTEIQCKAMNKLVRKFCGTVPNSYWPLAYVGVIQELVS
jgi:RNase P/RNase MRP subunit p30